jgi:plastocyanin
MYHPQTMTSSLNPFGGFWSYQGAGWNASQSRSTFPPVVTATSQIVNIVVGAEGDLRFNPDSISVSLGTTLRFDFLGKNHTLTQSSFNHPCQNSSGTSTDFEQLNALNQTGKFLFDYKVVSQKSQWFYCAQDFPKSHCHAGMVFSLNPGGEHQDFIEKAKWLEDVAKITPSPIKMCSAPSSTGDSVSNRTDGNGTHATRLPPKATLTPETSSYATKLGNGVGYFLLAVLIIQFLL